MKWKSLPSVLLLAGKAFADDPSHPHLLRYPFQAQQLILANRASNSANVQQKQTGLGDIFPAHNFSVPIDHFLDDSKYEPHDEGTFSLRYWYDARYYKPNGPVIVLAGGETSGTDRLPFLQKGILHILAKATNGIGVVLEHRYYGTSYPVPDLSVKNLRFLDTEQAMADVAYFAKNIKFEGLGDLNVTSKDTAWIVYGGSYAGGFAAFLRLLYPDVFWGAISSSGVTKAIIDYWQYWEAIRLYGPEDCIRTTQQFIEVIDGVLIDHKSNRDLTQSLKFAFGLPNISDNVDFAQSLTSVGIGSWQGRNWDPEVNSETFMNYCRNITADETIYSASGSLQDEVKVIIEKSGRVKSSPILVKRMLNWIGFIQQVLVQPCRKEGQTQDNCFGSRNQTFYEQDDLRQSWRSWSYQFCTQWGYYSTGSGTPPHILPVVSRTIDVEYLSTVCRSAFNLTKDPDVEAINKYGGFEIHFPRLAFLDGQADPWRWAGVHAPAAPTRKSTWIQPYIEIEGAVHHWDQNGLFPNETTSTLPPSPVVKAQKEEVKFVKAWLKGYHVRHFLEDN